jgi:hypothetical protein
MCKSKLAWSRKAVREAAPIKGDSGRGISLALSRKEGGSEPVEFSLESSEVRQCLEQQMPTRSCEKLSALHA